MASLGVFIDVSCHHSSKNKGPCVSRTGFLIYHYNNDTFTIYSASLVPQKRVKIIRKKLNEVSTVELNLNCNLSHMPNLALDL